MQEALTNQGESMLKTIPLSKIDANPFRRLNEYPIIREKIDALKESIQSTGFWGNIVARPVGDRFQIAYGHHRLVALKESKTKQVEVIVRQLSNEQMIQIMARENMEEWGTSAWVELETIRSVIDAYGRGEIELPKVPKNTDTKVIRQAGQATVPLPYTQATVAEFLGWTRKSGKDTRPNYACEQAFRALDMIDAGFIRERDLKGLGRAQMAALIDGQWRIYSANKSQAEAQMADAKRKERAAEKATDPTERQRNERQAAFLRKQAEGTQKKGVLDAKQFVKEITPQIRKGTASIRDVRQKAEERTAAAKREKIPTADELALKIASRLNRLANGDDDISAAMSLLKGNHDLSTGAARSLDKSIDKAIQRLEKIRARFRLEAFV